MEVVATQKDWLLPQAARMVQFLGGRRVSRYLQHAPSTRAQSDSRCVSWPCSYQDGSGRRVEWWLHCAVADVTVPYVVWQYKKINKTRTRDACEWEVKRRRPPRATRMAEQYDNQRASRSWPFSLSARPKHIKNEQNWSDIDQVVTCTGSAWS